MLILGCFGRSIDIRMVYNGEQGGEVKRTNIYLDNQDYQALAVIKAEHGIATDASAVRFAVRQVARDLERKAKREPRPARGAAGSSTD